MTDEAVRRGGSGVLCRPGCFECCLGSFEITGLDAARLATGFDELARRDPERAAAIRARATAFEGRDDEPCPVLDPQSGTCELYAWRPITCRVFGPAISYGSEGVRVCDLCYAGSSDEEIAALAVELDIDALEAELNGPAEPTTVAECLEQAGGIRADVRIPLPG